MPPKGYHKRPPTISPTELIPASRYEYATLSSERPLTTADLDPFGAGGWVLVGIYVRFDAVHAVFKRELS